MNIHNVIFDLDSTLTPIEGIDVLGEIRGIGTEISSITKLAMEGLLPLDDAFVRRLEMTKPTRRDLKLMARKYLDNITPGAIEVINKLRDEGKNVFVVTGGYAEAIYPLTDCLGIPRVNVYANEIFFDDKGEFVGLNKNIPLWKQYGKLEIVKKIKKEFPGGTVMIGDGMSDLEAAKATEVFIYFGGYVRRRQIEAKTEHRILVPNFYNLRKLIQQATA